MAAVPNYLQEQTEEAIRQRMLDSLPSDLDKSEGSFIWDAIAPAAIELAQAAIWAQEVLRRGFASTTFGPYLDMRCEEHGLTRRAAVKAKGQVKFTGKAGTVIPAGTRVATPADRVTGTSSVEFATKQAAVIDESGTATTPIEAVSAGALGNVSAGAISLMVSPVPGVTGVINLIASEGGIDTESDESLLARYLQKVRSPSAGGNKADYVNWALEVPGVGGVSVVPVRDGPGTVSVAIIDEEKEPAEQALVDEVQAYIAPPWKHAIEAESMAISGYGVMIDTGQGDDSGRNLKMTYHSSGPGVAKYSLQPLLTQPGIWQVRVSVKASSNQGNKDLLQVGVWNTTTQTWAKLSPSSSRDAMQTFQAEGLSLLFSEATQPFYWNGQDPIEIRITRLQADIGTTLWIDKCHVVSTFSKDSGEGKAPVGARVTVEPAVAVQVNVSAKLTITNGYNIEVLKEAATRNIAQYIKSLAFTDDNDVRNVRIGQAILDTIGIQDYENLLVNGGTGNVAVGTQEVAVLGTVSLS